MFITGPTARALLIASDG